MADPKDFDRTVAKLAVRSGKASEDSVRSAYLELAAWHETGRKGDLVDVLLSHRLISAKVGRKLRILATRHCAPQIAGYEILEPLGGGGMGIVYKARQIELDRIVALKVLMPEALDDVEALERFRREARAAGQLDHPNIVRAWDMSVGRHPEPPYLAMEYIRGETLHAILMRVGTLSERQALLIGRSVAAALDHAFRHGLVHRDVKPDNIMVAQDGTIKLCDLGLAKSMFRDQSLTRPDMTHGTPHFMSPEQAQGRRDLDIRSDLYSLGCTLYRIVVGRPPFNADSAMEILIKHLEASPPSPKAARPDLSIDFDRIVLRLLAKDPAERYQSPSHAQTDLSLVLDGEKPRIDYGVPFRPPNRIASRPSPPSSASGERGDTDTDAAPTLQTLDESDPNQQVVELTAVDAEKMLEAELSRHRSRRTGKKRATTAAQREQALRARERAEAERRARQRRRLAMAVAAVLVAVGGLAVLQPWAGTNGRGSSNDTTANTEAGSNGNEPGTNADRLLPDAGDRRMRARDAMRAEAEREADLDREGDARSQRVVDMFGAGG